MTVQAESVVLAHEPRANGAASMALGEFDAQGRELCEEHFDFIAATTYVPHLPRLAGTGPGRRVRPAGARCWDLRRPLRT